MGILRVDLDKINLHDDNNFYEDDPETIIHVRLSVWRMVGLVLVRRYPNTPKLYIPDVW